MGALRPGGVRPLKMAALLLSAHPLSEQPLLHLHPAHKTDLPMYLAQASAGARSYQRRSEGHEPLLVALVTKEHTWRQSSVTGNLVLLPCHRVLPTVCRTRWGMAPGPCFRRVGSPSVKPSMSLFPTPCSFFGLDHRGRPAAPEGHGWLPRSPRSPRAPPPPPPAAARGLPAVGGRGSAPSGPAGSPAGSSSGLRCCPSLARGPLTLAFSAAQRGC